MILSALDLNPIFFLGRLLLSIILSEELDIEHMTLVECLAMHLVGHESRKISYCSIDVSQLAILSRTQNLCDLSSYYQGKSGKILRSNACVT